ncbi:MAG: hypothetical protein KBB37_09305 [Bacteroidia bacterium]|nr:hypothetical protein [Bacteroidia bacterium]MBP7261469.1 hypothetical protein [Bacteroidia bacterium]
MQIKVKTPVRESRSKVWSAFNRELFLALAPPYPKVELLRFDGCSVNDEVHLLLKLGFAQLPWNARIVDEGSTETTTYFIDKGIVLPFPLQSWVHVHLIEDNGTGCTITDEVTFTTGNGLVDLFIYPFLFPTIYFRKFIYRRIFKY